MSGRLSAAPLRCVYVIGPVGLAVSADVSRRGDEDKNSAFFLSSAEDIVPSHPRLKRRVGVAHRHQRALGLRLAEQPFAEPRRRL